VAGDQRFAVPGIGLANTLETIPVAIEQAGRKPTGRQQKAEQPSDQCRIVDDGRERRYRL
jgi:hypothetical protein